MALATGGRGLLFLAIGVVSALLANFAHAAGIMHSLEFDSMDKRFQVRGEREPPGDVVVGIDEQTRRDAVHRSGAGMRI